MNNDVIKGFIKAVIFLFVVLLVWTLIRYSRWHQKDLDDFDIKYVERGEDIKEEIADKGEYEELYNRVSFEHIESNFGREFFNIYYEKQEFSDEYYIFMGLINILKDELKNNCNIEKTINAVEV